ncbi:cation transporter [Pelotomaculum propionicicum]
MFLNLIITAGKGVLAFLSGSTALFVETIHSISDGGIITILTEILP